LDKFNPALGTLTNIKLTLNGQATISITLTNTGASAVNNVVGSVSSSVQITSTLTDPQLANVVTLSASTGGPRTINPGSPVTVSGLTNSGSGFISVVYNSAAQSNFVSTGPLDTEISILLSSFTFVGSNGGNDITPSGNTQVNVQAEIEYTYTAAVQGDPQFAGFQGQQFQFHGLPDTVFNLVSSPELQMNAQFVYIASGVCNYNGTACFSHPGTYLGQVGVAIGSHTFTIVSGPHSKGLRVFHQSGIDRHAMIVGAKFSFTTQHGVMSISHPSTGNVEIRSPNFSFNVVNSDSFVNLEAALLNSQLLQAGAKHHNVKHCTNSYEIERSVSKHYPIKNYIHGLVGQTWRAVTFCDQPYQGAVGDYIASDLFSSDYRYNFFNATE